MLSVKFQDNWPFISEEAKSRFLRCRQWRPSWISHRGNISTFLSTSHPDASGQVSSQLVFRFRKRKIDFQDGGHLAFRIETILDICSTRHPDASYQISSQLAFQFRRRNEKTIFKIAAMATILDFRSERF